MMAIPAPKIRIKDYEDLGRYPRWYDGIVANNRADRKTIDEVTAWGKEKVSPHWLNELGGRRRARFYRAADNKKVPGVLQTGFFNDLRDITQTLYYNARDVLNRHRWKTALLIGFCLIAGSLLGAVVGGFLAFWGLTFLGSVTMLLLGQISGGLGMGILGALGGKWLGKKLSAKLFKREKRFGLSQKSLSAWKGSYKLNRALLLKMNAYLLNREDMAQDEELKKHYYYVLHKAVKKVDPTAVEKLTRFFCQELTLLAQARREAEGAETAAWGKERDFVLEVLRAFEHNGGISMESRERIQKTLEEFEREEEALSSRTTETSLSTEEEGSLRSALSSDSDSEGKRPTIAPFCDHKRIQQAEKAPSYYGYRPLQKEASAVLIRVEEPKDILSQKQGADGLWEEKVLIRHSLLVSKAREDLLAEMLMEELKKQRETNDTAESARSLIVYAAENRSLALELLRVAFQENFEPRLNEQEYPDAEEREQLYAQAKEKAAQRKRHLPRLNSQRDL